jgi:hypothetical protein
MEIPISNADAVVNAVSIDLLPLCGETYTLQAFLS